jgi:hypothetical protein
LSSDPERKCNSNLDSVANIVLQIFIGLGFTVTVLVVISSSTKKNDEGNATAQVGGHIIENEDNLDSKEDFNRQSRADEDHVFAISGATITF